MAKARVDFPLPFGPMSAWTRPGSMVRSIPLRISFPWTATRRSLVISPRVDMPRHRRRPTGESQGKPGLSATSVVPSRWMHARFFESTRGKIVGALRERHAASAFDLAELFGLSPNAIRQQLVVLERDGLISGRSVRRGKTKPTVEYSLTAEAARYFPQRYDKMLNAVLREIRVAGGDQAVKAVFDRIGKRTADRMGGVSDDH